MGASQRPAAEIQARELALISARRRALGSV